MTGRLFSKRPSMATLMFFALVCTQQHSNALHLDTDLGQSVSKLVCSKPGGENHDCFKIQVKVWREPMHARARICKLKDPVKKASTNKLSIQFWRC